MKRLLGLIILSTACASAPVRVAPVVRSDVRYGINDGFHGPLVPEVVAAYAGGTVVRTPQLSLDGALTFRASAPTLPTILLIEAPDVQLAGMIAGIEMQLESIENGNELELDPHQLTPEQYAAAQAAMGNAERAAGFTGSIIMGGVYALTDETKHAILLALPWCKADAHCRVGVHLYAPTQADVDWLNGLDVDVAVTETGSPTGCGTSRWQAQADYVAGVRALLTHVRRLKYFIVYQRAVGPSCSDLDTFGIEGKPLEALLKRWIQ